MEKEVPEGNDEPVSIADPEGSRLLALAQRRRGKRIESFNSADGIRLHLNLIPHNQRQAPGSKKYCGLCGSGGDRHRTSFKCAACDIPLCARAHPGLRKSCWAVWHEAKRLPMRTINSNAERPRKKRKTEHAAGECEVGEPQRNAGPSRRNRDHTNVLQISDPSHAGAPAPVLQSKSVHADYCALDTSRSALRAR
jgi:DDE_Tnp_1-like zinc-ribbon